jgi:phosphoglycolate phosphatase-like HAD superfamily hydrolase
MRKLCHIRLVIFDLDGTLIDSAEDIAIHVGRVYREFKGKDAPADSKFLYVNGFAFLEQPKSASPLENLCWF